MKPAKPIWGFGWAGCALLPVAVWLGWSYVFGPDLRFKLLELINNTLGIKAVFWTVLRPIYHNWISLNAPGLGWWGLLYVPIALHLHPRSSRWWWAPLVAWAALRSELYAHSLIRPGAGLSAVIMAASGGVLARESAALLLCCAVDILLLTAITRNWLPVGAAVLASALGIAAEQWSTLGPVSRSVFVQLLPVYAWHVMTAAALLTWAVRARIRHERPGFCKTCGYDLLGLADARCPECGGPVSKPGTGEESAAESGVHSPP